MKRKTKRILTFFLYFLGPGWVAMMADVDAPSVFTGIVAGAQFRYAFVGFLFLLIVPLYLYQEAVARMGILTKKGLAEVIKEQYGKNWSLISVGSMFAVNMLSYVAEFAGISAAGMIFGVPVWISVILTVIAHTFIVVTGSYKKAENILIFISMLLFIFVAAAITTKPNLDAIATSIIIPGQFTNIAYITLILGLIGAVIMPWMLFYQQAAVVDKKLTIKDLKSERHETLIGAVISEILMVAIVITAGNTLYGKHVHYNILNLAHIISPLVGDFSPHIFALGIIAAGFLGGVVVSLSSAWSLSEYFNWKKSLNLPVRKAKYFYIIYFIEIVPAALVPIFYPDLISLIIDTMVLNSIILPVPLIFIILLTNNKTLMHHYVNELWRKTLMWIFAIIIITSSITYLILSV